MRNVRRYLLEQIPADKQDGIEIFYHPQFAGGGIAEWATARRLDAMIWTALPPRLEDVEGLVPSVDDAISYLASLSRQARDHARIYIRQVPEQINTFYRNEIITRPGY